MKRGKITKWYGINTDIDERRRARILLAAEKGLLELLASGRPLSETLQAIGAAVEGADLTCYCEVQLTGGRSEADPRSVAPALRIPVVSKKGELLANPCLYLRGSSGLANHEDITALAAHIASIAIERHRAEDELRRREYILTAAERAGVGFAAGAAERMFQPFYTTKESGMGIGLSVSRSIVESHAGGLWAESVKTGEGALFSSTIPIKRP